MICKNIDNPEKPVTSNLAETTDLIQEWQKGNQKAFNLLIERVYDNLKNIAHRQLNRELRGSQLQTTELLNEACVWMMQQKSLKIKSREHLVNLVSQAIYRLLIDLARQRKALKYGGNYQMVDIEYADVPWHSDEETVLQIDQALNHLEKEDPKLVSLVKLRFFCRFYNIGNCANYQYSCKHR